MQVHEHIQAYALNLTGLFGSQVMPAWEEPLRDSLPESFTKAQRGILLAAATPVLRNRFEEVMSPRTDFKNVDEGFRHYLINAFADGVRQDLSVVNIWCRPSIPESKRQNGMIFQNLVDMQFNMEEILANYRLICGEGITPQFNKFLTYLELNYLPQLQNLISEAETEMRMESLREAAVTRALQNESKTHLHRIDPRDWRHATALNDLS
jgi:hypothetical protein